MGPWGGRRSQQRSLCASRVCATDVVFKVICVFYIDMARFVWPLRALAVKTSRCEFTLTPYWRPCVKLQKFGAKGCQAQRSY